MEKIRKKIEIRGKLEIKQKKIGIKWGEKKRNKRKNGNKREENGAVEQN